MFVAITNTPRPYAWGSTSAIAGLLGHTPSGGPEAELWLGAHPGSPSQIVDPSAVGGARTIAEWIEADPQTALGRFASSKRLPFLLKILAAAHPLSLQAHPNPEQALAGFERENALGIPLDAPHRNYRDASAKPELIYALSDTFDALCGFRPLGEVRALLELLLDLDAATEEPQPQPLEDLLAQLASDDALPQTFEWLISSGAGVPTLVSLVMRLAPLSAEPSLAVAAALAAEYPDDPGIVISLLLNRVTLARGEALYLPAGNIHAYLDGLGVELMAASDNVLRGGLTPKHIDVPELLGVLDFTPVPVPYLRAEGAGPTTEPQQDALTPSASDDGLTPGPAAAPASGIEVFRPDVADFVLVRVSGADLDAGYALTGPGIAICTAGELWIGGAASSVALGRGESVYITPDEGRLSFSGNGELFLATTGE
ncbi:mannose-6-phosphate isomerase, class I [Parafrigoribacterium soli]|uniref:mannose-6-phosphate isomerase, class I n=1 Tax=Parafrigoribacterium soli TaxID=3144663 RepID=UPI0032EDC4C4